MTTVGARVSRVSSETHALETTMERQASLLFLPLVFLLLLLLVAVRWWETVLTDVPGIRGTECQVLTSSGRIKGSLLVIEDKQVCQYLGIPYASSPTGRLRFAKPRPSLPWNGTLEALAFGADCPQVFPSWAKWMMRRRTSRWSEDCLFLNVWSPAATAARNPLLFWIHGGGFQFGSASLLETNGSFLAALHDVVVVTTNYR